MKTRRNIFCIFMLLYFMAQPIFAANFAGGTCQTSSDCIGKLSCDANKRCVLPSELVASTDTKEQQPKKQKPAKVKKKENEVCADSRECMGKLLCGKENRCIDPIKINSPPPQKSAPIVKQDEDYKNARFRGVYKENIILLWVSPMRTTACPDWGEGYAEERSDVLNEWKTVRTLCYKVDDKKRVVEFKDPQKNFLFNTFSIHTSSFTQLKWPSEIAAAQLEARNQAMAEAIQEVNAQMMEERRIQMNRPVYQPIYVEPPRGPTTCITMGAFTRCN